MSKETTGARARRHTWAAGLAVLAVGALLLAMGQLGHHPQPTRSDVSTQAELIEELADCGSVVRLVFEGSQSELNSDLRVPDVAWDESCMEQIQPHAEIGFTVLALTAALGTASLVLFIRARARRQTRLEGVE